MLLNVSRNDENSLFDAHYLIGVKRLKEFRLILVESEHKFRHNSWDTANLLFRHKTEIETANHYLLRYLSFTEQRMKLLENLLKLDYAISSHCDDDSIQILIYGLSKYSFPMNNKILSYSWVLRVNKTFWQTPPLSNVYLMTCSSSFFIIQF